MDYLAVWIMWYTQEDSYCVTLGTPHLKRFVLAAVAVTVRFVKSSFDKTCFDVVPAQLTDDGGTHHYASANEGDFSKMKR